LRDAVRAFLDGWLQDMGVDHDIVGARSILQSIRM